MAGIRPVPTPSTSHCTESNDTDIHGPPHDHDAHAPHDSELPGPGMSEVTLVEVTLLADLVRILTSTEAHHRALLEEAQGANAQRAALVEAQKVSTAATIRSASSQWLALPRLDGQPFPDDVEFPRNLWELRRMPEEQVRKAAAVYGIDSSKCNVDAVRDNLAFFVAGRRA